MNPSRLIFLIPLAALALLFMPVDSQIKRIYWGELLGPFTSNLNIRGDEDSASETQLDFFWKPQGGPATEDDRYLISARYMNSPAEAKIENAEPDRFPPSPEHSGLTVGDGRFGISGINSTFRKAVVFHRRNMTIWVYHHTSDSEKLNSLLEVLDNAIVHNVSVRQRSTPLWKHLRAAYDAKQRASLPEK